MKSVNFNIKRYNGRNIVSSILIMTLINCSFTHAQEAQVAKVSPVVSASWLKDNLSEPGIIVLHVAGAKLDYDNGHIPGAGFLWPGYVIISTENESVIPAPTADVTKLLRSLGVNNNSHIVLCGIYGNIIPVCRVLVNLEHMGMKEGFLFSMADSMHGKQQGTRYQLRSRNLQKENSLPPLI